MTRALVVALTVTLALAGVLAWVGEPGRWPEAESLPQQGEATDPAATRHAPVALARLVREPQNTWSNLAFVFGGAGLASLATSRIARAVGVVLIAVGVGSFLYHASASRMLRQVDVAAMYWLFLTTAGLCLAAALPRWAPWVETHAGLIAFVALAAAVGLTTARNVVLLGFKPLSLKIATAAAAATIILSLAQVTRKRETVSAALQLLGIVTLFGAAALCQTWDRPGGRFYQPAAVVQAHAVWHVLAAITFVWAVAFLDRTVSGAAGGSGGANVARRDLKT